MKTAYISHRLAEDKFVNVKYHHVKMMTSTKYLLSAPPQAVGGCPAFYQHGL